MTDKENLLRFNFRGSYDDLIPVENGELVRAFDYDRLAAKLAEAERVARYETDIAQQALDQMRAAEQRVATLEARIAHLENHIEAVAKDTHKIMVAYATAHATVLGVAQTLEDAYWSREVTPTPTAAELMARIQKGEE